MANYFFLITGFTPDVKLFIANHSMKKQKVGRPQKGLYKMEPNGMLLTTAFSFKEKYMVYGLASSDTPNCIEYIGYTSLKPNLRYNNHIGKAAF